MDDYRNHNEPWDPSIYGTGRTQPPKSHGGIVAFLLVIVIFLGGLVSVLGVLNVKLFTQLKELSYQQTDSLSVVDKVDINSIETAPVAADTEPSLPQTADHQENQIHY